MWCRRAICGVVPAVAAANKALSAALREGAANLKYLAVLASTLEVLVIDLIALTRGEAASSAGQQDLVFRVLTCGVVVLDSGSLAYRLHGLHFAEMPFHLIALEGLLRDLAVFEREGGGQAVAALRATTYTPAAITHALGAVAWVEAKPGGLYGQSKMDID